MCLLSPQALQLHRLDRMNMLKSILILNNHQFVIVPEDLVMLNIVPDFNKSINKKIWCFFVSNKFYLKVPSRFCEFTKGSFKVLYIC